MNNKHVDSHNVLRGNEGDGDGDGDGDDAQHMLTRGVSQGNERGMGRGGGVA